MSRVFTGGRKKGLLRSVSLLTFLFDAAETHVIGCRPVFAFSAAACHIAGAILIGTKKRATPLHFLFFPRFPGIISVGGPLRVPGNAGSGRSLIVVWPVPVAAPFPNIPG